MSMAGTTKSWSPHVQTQQRSKMPNKMVNDCINDPCNHHFCLLLEWKLQQSWLAVSNLSAPPTPQIPTQYFGCPIVHLRCDSIASVAKFAYMDVMSALGVQKKCRSKQITYKFMSWIEAKIHKQDERERKEDSTRNANGPLRKMPMTKVPNDERYLHLIKFK